ncbi:MAG: cupin-like domain-containing protein [Deltaproteobacteria bacterium]|nr:cupin-like domain-containing protein [Deltaproteobacteria bacterium]
MAYFNPGITFDIGAYHPFKVMAVQHQLMDHPLLKLERLVELGDRLAKTGSVRHHNDQAKPDTNFVFAPESHRARLSPAETLRQIEKAQAWLALHNVQQDPVYRGLVDEVLDFVKPLVDMKDPGMCHRAGWIFVTSPGAVTPYHMDHEHNFILQIRGNKTLHVWEPLDREVVSERALELFHGKLSRELVVYRDELLARAHVFQLKPGMGGYMPQTAPHWVKNGDEVSITASFTFYTDATRRRALLHRGNEKLRAVGITPSPVGSTPLVDGVKHLAFRAQQELKTAVNSARGKPNAPPTDGTYAPVA